MIEEKKVITISKKTEYGRYKSGAAELSDDDLILASGYAFQKLWELELYEGAAYMHELAARLRFGISSNKPKSSEFT